MKPARIGLSSALLVAHVSLAMASPALPMTPRTIDNTVARAMKAFQVPGMAVGIVKDGKVVFAKGYGVREAGKTAGVDTNTLFQIGSNTKAVTAAALAILVDEGKLRWDDRVIDVLPQFRMYDPYVTREFTVRDLLTHRSGLGQGAGDLMFFPETDMTREEIIHGLRYLKPTSSFRSKYDYDNLLYMVAGQLIPAITGQSWEEFVTQRILGPLRMSRCTPRYDLITNGENFASPHVVINGRVQPVSVVDMRAIGPAGTINCNISGMARWLETQLAQGMAPSGQRLFSAERSAEMWQITTPMPLNPLLSGMYETHFSGYGFGWELSDAHGYRRVHHTGGVLGSVTWVSMIPELGLGVIVLTNQQSGAAMEAVGGQILDAYLGVKRRDWVAIAQSIMAEREADALRVEQDAATRAATAAPPALEPDAYTGTYRDSWRGEATVRRVGTALVLEFSRTHSLEGTLTPYRGNVFIVRWKDRSLNADAFVRFEQGFEGRVSGMTLRAISPTTDFSFDFQDLDFKKDPSP
jgi:CubicO group peptidase (beta-lactamase class C family)